MQSALRSFPIWWQRPARFLGGCLVACCVVSGAGRSSERVANGGFETGLKSWQTAGDVGVERNPSDGTASAVIGPGSGSLRQRVETGSGNDFTVSATIRAQSTNGWVFAIRFLDKKGRVVMKVDSADDIEITGENPRRINHYMQSHPLTKWIEIVISKDQANGSVFIDKVGLEMVDENAAGLKPTCDLEEAMQPFWEGKTVHDEAVLMMSQGGRAASGRLMFRPSRIVSVRDYSLKASYVEGKDYTVDGRTLVCTASSRMPRLREEDVTRGELKWSTVGGKQVMVTYEHDDTWNHPHPTFAGERLPHTLRKLEDRAPLIVVAYGDSITHGVGESRLSHIPPFVPPWPELFVHRMSTIYKDRHIRLYNSAQSGADSNWGKKYAGSMVESLNPDLVIIAFGQNDFWNVSADSFASNITDIIGTVRNKNPDAEFVLVSTLRFDPAYTSKAQYWNAVGEYAGKLRAMTGPGVEVVDMTAISESVYAAKKPRDCLNDPLHPNDYFARWYAQSVVATLDPASGRMPTPMASGDDTKGPGRFGDSN